MLFKGGMGWRYRPRSCLLPPALPAVLRGWAVSRIQLPHNHNQPHPQASFLPMLFWLGLPELGRDLVLLVRMLLGAV